MAQATLRVGMSEQEYLALERTSGERHEYAQGELYAMAGGTRAHSLIAGNILRELGLALLDRPCEVHGPDLRIKIAATGRYTYADVLVVCGRPLFEDEQRDNLLNPRVIVEVLSDSTERYDRGEKFAQYRLIPSLLDYVLVSQRERLIERFRRQDDEWLFRALGPGQRLSLESIGCELEVDRAYLKVFDAPTDDGAA